MLDLAGRVFRKCISLLEQRLHIKISNAVLIIASDDGEHIFQLKDDDYENLSLMSRHFQQLLITAVGRRRFIAGLVACSLCLGTGRASPDNYESCPKCNGGGQVALIDPSIAQNEPYQTYDKRPNSNSSGHTI